VPDTFDLAAVESAISATSFAGALHHLASTPSTNDLALAAAHAGARSGVWIADRQTAGRGRGGHSWHSAAGTPEEPAGLYMTALISPQLPIESALRLALATAIAVQSAIASTYGFEIRDQIDIRWPNDLLLAGKDGRARKVGGILIETAAQPAPFFAAQSSPAMLRYAAVGIGVNVNHTAFPPELEAIATSLRRELPDRTLPLRRGPLAAAILLALDAEVRRLATDSRELTTEDLSRHSSWISGKRVRVEARDGDPGYTGITAGLDALGFLLVQGDDGQSHTVLSGGLREPDRTDP